MDAVSQKLFEAVQAGATDSVVDLLKLHHDHVLELFRDPDKARGRYYLHEACLLGYEDIALYLVAYYDDMNQKSPKGTPLHLACEFGYYGIVDMLLCNKACVPEPTPGVTQCPFYAAAYNGCVDILGALLNARPDLQCNKFVSRWCLDAAICGGHLDITKVCYNNFRRLHSSLETREIMAELLVIACEAEHSSIIQFLISCDAQLTADVIEQYTETLAKVLHLGLTDLHNDPDNASTPSDTLHPSNLSLQLAKWSSMNLHQIHPSWIVPYSDRLSQLNISKNKLLTLPEQIPWQLPHLTELNVSHNQLCELQIPTQLKCISLKTFSAAHNELVKVPTQLFHLNSLENLDLSYNMIRTLEIPQAPYNRRSGGVYSSGEHYIDVNESLKKKDGLLSPDMKINVQIDFDQVWSCLSLRKLDMTSNCLCALPSQLQMCGQLTILRASANKLTHFLPSWSCPLEVLDVSDNLLTELPEGLDQNWSHCLTSLFLQRNKFVHLPHTVTQLKNLTVLDISCNQLTELPPAKSWRCSQLVELDLSHNKLCCYIATRRNLLWMPSMSDLPPNIEFPEIFADTLTDLDLSYNQLRSVPPSVCNLLNMQRLQLNHNPDLQSLPPELGRLQECFDLRLDETNITNIPRNFMNPPVYTRSILAHLKHLLRRSEPYHGMKLVIIGQQGVGKSRLAYQLQGKSKPTGEAEAGITIHDWTVSGFSMKRKIKVQPGSQEHFPDVNFQIWDCAGQTDLHTTHKLFLSSCTLYLVLFDLRLQKEGVRNLKPWLLDIEAHAAKSHVIVVGTFLDYLNKDGRSQVGSLHAETSALFRPANGYPSIDYMTTVSCTNKEGISQLKEMIYRAATGLRYASYTSTSRQQSLERMVGRKIPQSYLDLGKAMKLESFSRRRHGQLPIMNTKEVLELAESLPGNDISSPEELDIATNFLHEAGFILHYTSSLRGLHELYFLDPSWLADNLSKLINIDPKHQCIREGILDLAMAQSLLFTEATHKSARLGQYVDLLEKFEIALLMNKERLLIPSKIQNTCPESVQMSLRRDNYALLHRVYSIKCTPSGFWPRVILQFITMVQRVCEKEVQFPVDMQSIDNKRPGDQSWDRIRVSYGSLPLATNNVKVTYWQQGICLDYGEGVLVVESCDQSPSNWRVKSSGVIITLATSPAGEASVLGFAADQIEHLITQWFSGLLDETNPMERLVPCPSCVLAIQQSGHHNTTVHMFDVHDCVLEYLENEQTRFTCPECKNKTIPPERLIPDFTLSDLPKHLLTSKTNIFTDDEPQILGRGGEGVVYQGVFADTIVAIKENSIVPSVQLLKCQISDNLLAELSKSCDETDQPGASMITHMTKYAETVESSLDSRKWLLQFKLIPAFQDFRKEVSLLSRLKHPHVIALLGILPPHLSYVMELAPLGSLHKVLQNLYKQRMERHPLANTLTISDMLMDRLVTCKITHQMATALQYLHSNQVVYKDLKPQNVLVWSIDPDTQINIKLSDYGLSSYLSPQGIKGCEGTLGYQAPEMRHGSSYNEKVDLFALGMVIYQMFTGLQLFSSLASVLIPKLIKNGKRPSLQEAQVCPDLPKLVMLMESCWSTDPEERPVAGEVVSRISDPSFWMLRYCSPREDSDIIAVHINSDENTDDPNCYYVTAPQSTENSSCYFCILNAPKGQHKIKQPVCGSRVTCMTYIGHVIIVGTEGNELHVYRSERTTGRQVEVCPAVITDDTPLVLLYKDTQSSQQMFALEKDLYVSFADGSLSKFKLSMTSKSKANLHLDQQHKFGVESELNLPIKCMIFIEQSLWIGHGSNILVVDPESLIVRHKIQIFNDTQITSMPISNMCCHGDQVWCFCRGSWDVVEIDVGTLTKVCKLDCSMGNVTGVAPVEWFELAETKPMSVWTEKTQHTPKPFASRRAVRRSRQSVELTPTKDKSVGIPQCRSRVMTDASNLQKLQRKFSFRIQSKNIGRSGSKHKHPLYQVRSLCYVDGAIWVGRKCGDILVINVTHNSPCHYKYGEVVAVLCNQYHSGYANGSVEYLVPTKDRIVAIRMLSGGAKGERQGELVVWSATGMEQLHNTQKYWNIS